MKRRSFVKSLSAASLLLSQSPNVLSAQSMEALAPATATPGFMPDVEILLRAVVDEVSLREGAPTQLWRFNGELMKGQSNALAFLDGSGHVPIIRVRRGQKIRIHFENDLPESSIVHWHGLNIPQRMDGHPMYAIAPGERYVYEIAIDNRAGTYWFHPHPHERTSFQVYQGLVGMLIVHDVEEDLVALPTAEQDIPLMIQDRSFSSDNQLEYIGPMRMNWMMGFRGDYVLVNGRADYNRTVSRCAHRVRIINTSNASLYQLRWSDGSPFTVIATDGGLLEQSRTQSTLTLGVGERVEVWVDFSAHNAGDEVHLLAESYTPSLQNFTAEQGGRELQDGARPIASFQLSADTPVLGTPPQQLSQYDPLSEEDAVNADSPRPVSISMMRGSFYLNNRLFGAMQDVPEENKVKLGTTEVWEFKNDSSMGMGMGRGMGGMMQMAHPMHVHNVQFKVLSRTRAGQQSAEHQQLSAGFTDYGLKDVVVVLPGETVRVLMKFENYTGIYLYHCHILEHEDLGMMQNYLIEA
ncbi:MAG: multicopper oxidase family protein [Gammaproteobacteria bacterium]